MFYTFGYFVNLGSTIFTSISQIEYVPIDSIIESKYISATQATKKIIWLRKILEDLHEKKRSSTPLFIDNSSTIQLTKNHKFHDRRKHTNTKYHLIRHYI